MCEYQIQIVEYPLNICFHMEDRFIIILIISDISSGQHVQDDKSNGRAEKANPKQCMIGRMALNPRKFEYNII